MTPKISRILVPLDFSSYSENILIYAVSLAERFGASLHLLHVVENPVPLGGWSGEIYVPNMPELQETLVVDARRRLEEYRNKASIATPAEGEVHLGYPATKIVETAAAAKCDLIVMGTHGRTGLSHLLVGSVAEKVIRLAPC